MQLTMQLNVQNKRETLSQITSDILNSALQNTETLKVRGLILPIYLLDCPNDNIKTDR